MHLSAAQRSIWEKTRALGSGDQAVALTDGMCNFLIATIVSDLGYSDCFPELAAEVPPFFGTDDLTSLVVEGPGARALFERLIELDKDADTYFACLASLHKARLKYDVILRTQPIPTLEQVGPRGLLQFGQMESSSLAGLLFWRKWFFDIDNRAGQETGYLFEPVIAYAVGGTPVPARKSPVRRHRDHKKGRQVDCLLDNSAYEIKIRVTIAASGQGRWREELDYPIDCRESGYDPVLVVLDGTPNPKLAELERAFLAQDGQVHIGAAAWEHLDNLAGPTMAQFLERYVRAPIDRLIDEAPTALPEFNAVMSDQSIDLTIGDDTLRIPREPDEDGDADRDSAPEDAQENIPGL